MVIHEGIVGEPDLIGPIAIHDVDFFVPVTVRNEDNSTVGAPSRHGVMVGPLREGRLFDQTGGRAPQLQMKFRVNTRFFGVNDSWCIYDSGERLRPESPKETCRRGP